MKKTRKRFYLSLRFLIFFNISLIGILSITILKYGIISSVREQRIKLRQNDIASQCLIISNHITDYDYFNNPQSEMINSEVMQLATMFSGRILILNKEFKIVKDTFDLDVGKTDISKQAIITFRNDKTYIDYDRKHKLMEVCFPIHKKIDSKEVTGLLMIAVSTDSLEETTNKVNQKANILLFIFYAIIIFMAFFISIFLTAPINRIISHLSTLVDGRSSDELKVYNFKETALFSDKFNLLFARMKSIDESRQEFVSNVSHELKTPMASIKVLADSLLSDESAPRELYIEFLKDIADEIDRENRIITDLLSLVRLDKKAGSLDIQSVNINEMVEEVLKLVKPIADDSHIDIVFESFRPITAEVDKIKLSQAVMNLVENAVKYNNEIGWVHVSINSDHKYFYIKVSDNGIGIPEDQLDRIFDRFYRVDKSHSREINGTGLGLALTKSTVILHHGSIKVNSILGDGTTFDIRIPLAYSEK